MERIVRRSFAFVFRNYVMLTKPGIIMGNALTASGGFALAAKGHFDPWLFLAALLGLALIIGSACVFNNYIDRDLDSKMKRTKNRALVRGLISGRNALIFATILALIGTIVLTFFVNLLTAVVALIGFFVYVVLYSFLKYQSIHGTLIGSIAGAMPPVVGYCAARGHLDLGALIIFVMIALWQMPHFFAIAINHLEDYAATSIPLFPIKKGMRTTKIHMLLYIVAFAAASFMLTLFGYTGYAYLIVAALLSSTWLWLSIKGFKCTDDRIWARKMFRFSLIIVTALCITIPFSVI